MLRCAQHDRRFSHTFSEVRIKPTPLAPLGERVARSAAFTSRRWPGEGSLLPFLMTFAHVPWPIPIFTFLHFVLDNPTDV